MARAPKDARPEDAATEEVAAAPASLSAALADSVAKVEAGPVHGALAAIESALNDLKRRAESVEEHLAADFSELIERIKAL